MSTKDKTRPRARGRPRSVVRACVRPQNIAWAARHDRDAIGLDWIGGRVDRQTDWQSKNKGGGKGPSHRAEQS